MSIARGNCRAQDRTDVTLPFHVRFRKFIVVVAMGVMAAFFAARIDDVRAWAGWGRMPALEIVADQNSVLARRRGVSSVEISLSQNGVERISPSNVLERVSRTNAWGSDPMAGMAAVGWAGPVSHLTLYRQGWPFAAFSASLTGQNELRGGVFVGDRRNKRPIAFSPVLPGAIVNTVFFSILAWMMVYGPGVFVRARRRWAGLCERCAYSRRGIADDAVCPECGRAKAAAR